MRFTSTTVCVLASAYYASAAPSGYQRSTAAVEDAECCENPSVRKEWRKLTTAERKDYIDAVLCLQDHPAITKEQFADNPDLNPINRYDDFHAVHNSQTPNIHFVGHFASWHRYYVHEYERTLREVCGYKGSQPYWDWSLDAEPQNNLSMAIYDTVVFSPTEGFGGNGKYVEMDPEVEGIFRDWGRSGGGCVEEGPFTVPNFHVNIGEKNGSSCLRRDFLPAVLHVDADPKEVQKVLDQPNFAAFDRQMEGEPAFDPPAIHAGGHFGIGGLMGQAGDAANSPGGKYHSSQHFWSTLLTATDPLFYMHHTMIDYVYWKWQQKDLETRNNQVGGPVTPYDYTGTNVTMDFEIDLGDIAPSVPLRDTLDTQGKLFCYTYE